MEAGTSTLTTRLLLQVVAERGGRAAVGRVLHRAGLSDRAKLLRSSRGRVSYPEKLRLFEAAAAELGDPRVGLRLGAAAMRERAAAPLRALARAAGSPAGLLRHVSRISTRLDTTAVLRCERVSPTSATLAWRVLPPHRPNRVDCDYTLGMLAQAPVLFGLPAARVRHEQCQLDGAQECVYEVQWHEAGPGRRWLRRVSAPRRCRHAEEDGTGAEERLRTLHAAGSDLVSGESVEDVLERIATRADSVVHAPGHLLAVRLPTGAHHVRSRGAGSVVADALAAGADVGPGTTSVAGLPVLVAEVATARASYGVLAAVALPGQEFFPEDAETLAAFARHAAVGVEMATLLAEARAQEETAQLLLDVSRALAGRSSTAAVVQAVADAAPALVGAQRSAVVLCDGGAGRVRSAAASGWPADLAAKHAAYTTTAQESPQLREMLTAPGPHLVDRSSSRWAQELLDEYGVDRFAVVPIALDEEVLGLVLAHWVHEGPQQLDATLTERMSGLAGMAAVALDNARLLDEVRRQALHDPLTGLANRVLFEDRLGEALARAARGGHRVGVLFCDVNRFKRVNDSLGHGAGDELLRHVAGCLQSAVREVDTVARYSGDEFVVLLSQVRDEADAEHVAARIRASLADPVAIGGEQIVVDIAVGTALSEPGGTGSPRGAEHGAQLVERADEAMYQVKARTRGRVARSQPCPERLRLETELRGAVERDELRVHYQPQVDLEDGRIVAVEALVRWEHPELGRIPPLTFIPIAEESGLIEAIGAHVLREACRTVAGWSRQGLDVELAVNVSAAQLDGADFPRLVRRTLCESGLPADRLTLEITESLVVSDAAIDGQLHELRGLGVGISVDDFGTGYSSLSQLHRLPVTEVKVDRAFTAQLDSATPSPFVAGIVGLGHGLGVRVLAEGVETQDQLQALRQVGCHRVQGYLFAAPAEAATVLALLRSQAAARSSAA